MNLEIIKNIKNLTIINFNNLVYKALLDKESFIDGAKLTISDDSKLFQYFLLYNFLESIKLRKNYSLLLYLENNSKLYDKKFFNFLIKKLKCKFVNSNIEFNEFIKLINIDSPEYDEYITYTFSISENLDTIKKYIKKNNFIGLINEYSNISNQFKLILPKC